MTDPAASCHTPKVPVKPSPAAPAPAATLVLLRNRAAGGVETLLIQRHHGSRFAAGDFVFPGGRVEPADVPDDGEACSAEPSPAEAARTLGLEAEAPGAVAYWVGAIREAFEEVGILLARDGAGRFPVTADPRFVEHRQACQQNHRALWDVLRIEGLRLATDRLAYFAHWITPEENPIRFDTRFFVAEMPSGQDAVADGREIIAVRWLSPADAVAAMHDKEISLRLPTLTNLRMFDGARSAAEAIERVAGRGVPTIRPRVIVENGVRRALLPGDPGYY
jgi:8-oxo-dGTP pyrophosphatase MutT (NUDIX family)